MQMEMTQRDKKLLMYLGLIVVIVCFGYWGVRPLVKDIGETDEAIEVAVSEQQINELKQVELPLYIVENEELEQEIIDARAGFYPMMSADKLDKMMTGMVLDYNLYAYDLSIAISEDEVVSEAYKYSDDISRDDASTDEEESEKTTLEEVDAYASNDSETEVYDDMISDASTGIYVARIRMKVGGTVERLQKLIDDLSNSKEQQLVREYSWEESGNVVVNDSGDYEFISERYLNITLDIYMCEE